MVEAADPRQGYNLTFGRLLLDGTFFRGILIQTQMSPVLVIVAVNLSCHKEEVYS